eukprot:874307-Pyramimonas_sp.AAC.1
MARWSFCSASGRRANACTLFCVAENLDATFEGLLDSGDFESVDCRFAAGLSIGPTTGLRHRMGNLKAQEHRTSS